MNRGDTVYSINHFYIKFHPDIAKVEVNQKTRYEGWVDSGEDLHNYNITKPNSITVLLCIE